MEATRIAEIALFSPPFSTLSYSLPPYLKDSTWMIGQRVAIPLGKSLRAGIILDLKLSPDREKGGRQTETFSLKHILWPLEKEALLKPWYIALAKEIAIRHAVEPGQIFMNILPQSLRTTQIKIRLWGNGKPKDILLKSLQTYADNQLSALGENWINGQAEILTAKNRLAEICVLLKDPPWPIRPAAKVQYSLLDHLLVHGPQNKKKLLADFGKEAAAPLFKLAEKGLIAIKNEDSESELDSFENDPSLSPPTLDATGYTLTAQQQAVFDDLCISLHAIRTKQHAETHLLFGITGSGKTAIYLELARKCLNEGHSVLLLAPEVALAYKLRNDVKSVLPEANLLLFHGYLSQTAKETIFQNIAQASAPCIVVGTRSALFLPLEKIGLIILDEEHDSSFKQDEGLNYQAKEIAWYRAGIHSALLLLGSATPDIKSYYAAKRGKLPLHILSERVSGGALPEISIVPLLSSSSTKGLLTAKSIGALHETVEKGEQAVILLNRRGYSPLMYCLGCGCVAKCPQCDIGLTYHKGRERLVCHYCGYSVPFPSPCPTCNGLHFLPMGEGTEKLEEHLAELLPPGTGLLRLDRDSTRRQGKIEDILSAFARKEASVLVGTQMLSKGHHFPDVTLAIIADADLGLNLPDYRATERTFQLLTQSAGRSGRGNKKGQVIIQTRNPTHYCWDFVKHADYDGFYQHEIILRQKRTYPPFVNLALLRISYAASEHGLDDLVARLGKELKEKSASYNITMLGPTPAPIPFLKGRKRYQCLFKGKSWQDIRLLFSHAKKIDHQRKLRLSLDLDPVNML